MEQLVFCVAVVEPAERDLGRKLIRDCPAQEALQDFLQSEGGNGSSAGSVSTNCRSPSGFHIFAPKFKFKKLFCWNFFVLTEIILVWRNWAIWSRRSYNNAKRTGTDPEGLVSQVRLIVRKLSYHRRKWRQRATNPDINQAQIRLILVSKYIFRG